MFEPLERAGYEDRRSQKAMAEKVKEVMDTKKVRMSTFSGKGTSPRGEVKLKYECYNTCERTT